MEPYKNPRELLDARIISLEESKLRQKKDLKLHWEHTVKSMSPSNIINQVVSDISKTPDVKGNVVVHLTSFLGGYISKKLVLGNSQSLFKKLIGYVFQNKMMRLISKKLT